MTKAEDVKWPSSPYLHKHDQDVMTPGRIAKVIPRRSSMGFQDGIGRKFRADEWCQFGVCTWCKKCQGRGDCARCIGVYRLTTVARTSIEIVSHRYRTKTDSESELAGESWATMRTDITLRSPRIEGCASNGISISTRRLATASSFNAHVLSHRSRSTTTVHLFGSPVEEGP